MGIQELQAQMAAAIANNDVAGMEAIAAQIVSGKKERAKVEAEKLQKESEALAGAREKLAASIHETVKKMIVTGKTGESLNDALKAVKAWGFTYKVDNANPNEPGITYKSVSLTTATVKAPKAAGGGGGTGKTKDEFGLSLAEVFESFATPNDRAALEAARSSEAEKGITNSGLQHNVKLGVKKRVIASGELKPTK